MYKLALALCLLALPVGCTAPRLFQSKVPAPVTKSPEQTEAERQGADLIARKLETPAALRPVAQSLSTSLGKPRYSLVDISNFDINTAAHRADVDLQAGIVSMQKQLDTLNRRLSTLQGKDIEGTGISVFGPGVIALIAFGVIFPPAFTLLGILYRRLRQTSSMIIDQIDEAAKAPETAAAITALKSELKGKMDIAHKRVVSNLQKL